MPRSTSCETLGQPACELTSRSADKGTIVVGESVQLVPEADPSKTYPGKVLRIAPVFGERKLQSDDPSQRTDDRVVETVVSADSAPFLIGQRVLVKFLKAGAS